jgi:hypothetical protein
MAVYWWVFATIIAVLALLATILAIAVVAPRLGRSRQARALKAARESFHRHREWLEARFLTLASQSGTPRGLRWADCDFEDDVAFAREPGSGRLRALVGVTVKFEPVEGGEMEAVEAVHNSKAATVLFRLDGPEWEPDCRAYFNLNPSQMLEHFSHELKQVDTPS